MVEKIILYTNVKAIFKSNYYFHFKLLHLISTTLAEERIFVKYKTCPKN